jgi:tetratricopeptide (TPR) repeat protein
VHFSVENPDFADLQAQAHLILGCREPLFSEYEDRVPYMLAHLKQAIKYDRFSLDAHFLSGILLAKLERFDEARAAFKLAAGLAPAEAKPEIAAALKDLQVQEAQKKAKDAIKAAQQAAAAKQAPQPTDH